MFKDKTFLITGGTGSFGGAAVKYLLAKGCREIRILSRDEAKQHFMRNSFASPNVKFFVGDVRDSGCIDLAMCGVDYVFHAAALKQVPSCEFFPMQAVMTNITGSHNVAEAAIRHRVKAAVFLSTDKAVYPINAMGMSKGLMEKVVRASARRLSSDITRLICVRYGNVMYSRGSVIPHFIEQITNKKPITITDPKMTRFLLSLEDAISLVFYALENGGQGDIFIKKAPASTVLDLAEALKELFNTDVPVHEIGIRHGEKIHETLATFEELQNADDMGEYFRIKLDERDLNYNTFHSVGVSSGENSADYASDNTYQLAISEIKELLISLPEVQQALNEA